MSKIQERVDYLKNLGFTYYHVGYHGHGIFSGIFISYQNVKFDSDEEWEEIIREIKILNREQSINEVIL